MKTFEELLASGTIDLKEAEKLRIKVHKMQKNFLTMILILIGISIGAVYAGAHIGSPLPYISIMLGGFACAYYYQSKKAFAASARQAYIEKLLEFIDPFLSYKIEQYFDESCFEMSRLYINKDVTLKYGNHLNGKYLGIAFECVKLVAKRKMHRYDNQIQLPHTFFEGMFYAVRSYTPDNQFHFEINSKDKLMRLTKYDRRITRENPRKDICSLFGADNQKYFSIFTNDEAKALQYISPALLQHLSRVNVRYKQPCYLSLRNGKLYYGIQRKMDFYKLDFSKSFLDGAQLKRLYHDFAQAHTELGSMLALMKK